MSDYHALHRELEKFAKRLDVSRILHANGPLDDTFGQYVAAGSSDPSHKRVYRLSKHMASWLDNEALIRHRAVILLNSRVLNQWGLISTLAHEVGHHISAMAEGGEIPLSHARPAPRGLLRAFKAIELSASPESLDEVRAETIGHYLIGGKPNPRLRQEVYGVLSRIARRKPKAASLVKHHHRDMLKKRPFADLIEADRVKPHTSVSISRVRVAGCGMASEGENRKGGF